MKGRNEFAQELRSRGLRLATNPFAMSYLADTTPARRNFDADWIQFSGKRLEPYRVSAVANGLSDALLSYKLPQPKTTIDRGQVCMTAYTRFAILGGYPTTWERRRRVAALVVICAEFRCSGIWPMESVSADEDLPEFMIRVLELTARRDAAPDLIESVGTAIGKISRRFFDTPFDVVSAAAAEGLAPTPFPLHLTLQMPTLDDAFHRVLGDVALRSMCEPFENVEFDEAEHFYIDPNRPPQLIGPDDQSEQAIAVCRFGRKSSKKAPRIREAPNAVHQFVVRFDPFLRYKAGRVFNLCALAAEQAEAAVPEVESMDGSLDFQLVSKRRAIYEQNVEAMKANPSGDSPIAWLLLVDSGTNVFVAKPIPASNLDHEAAIAFLAEAWRGELGMLRGPPAQLCVAVSYGTGQGRQALADFALSHGAVLTAPRSGFESFVHVGKFWCADTRYFDEPRRVFGPYAKRPVSASAELLDKWTQANLLAVHAMGFFDGDRERARRYVLVQTPTMRTIASAAYAMAAGLGEFETYLSKWRERCLNPSLPE